MEGFVSSCCRISDVTLNGSWKLDMNCELQRPSPTYCTQWILPTYCTYIKLDAAYRSSTRQYLKTPNKSDVFLHLENNKLYKRQILVVSQYCRVLHATVQRHAYLCDAYSDKIRIFASTSIDKPAYLLSVHTMKKCIDYKTASQQRPSSDHVNTLRKLRYIQFYDIRTTVKPTPEYLSLINKM